MSNLISLEGLRGNGGGMSRRAEEKKGDDSLKYPDQDLPTPRSKPYTCGMPVL